MKTRVIVLLVDPYAHNTTPYSCETGIQAVISELKDFKQTFLLV